MTYREDPFILGFKFTASNHHQQDKHGPKHTHVGNDGECIPGGGWRKGGWKKGGRKEGREGEREEQGGEGGRGVEGREEEVEREK